MKYLELFEEFNFDIESSNAYGNSLDVVINDGDFTFNINGDDVSFANNDDYERAFELGIEMDDELRTYIIDEYNKMIGKTKMKRFGFFKETLEHFPFKEYIQDITTLCLVELEDNGYQISLTPALDLFSSNPIENTDKSYIVSIGQFDQLTNFKDIEDYLMTYIDLIKSKSDVKITNILAFLKDYPEGYNSNRVSINHIQKETLDFNGSYDNFFNYIKNKPMNSIMVTIDKIL